LLKIHSVVNTECVTFINMVCWWFLRKSLELLTPSICISPGGGAETTINNDTVCTCFNYTNVHQEEVEMDIIGL